MNRVLRVMSATGLAVALFVGGQVAFEPATSAQATFNPKVCLGQYPGQVIIKKRVNGSEYWLTAAVTRDPKTNCLYTNWIKRG